MRLERFKIKGWQNDKYLLTCWLRSPFQFLIRQQLVRKSSIRNERSTSGGSTVFGDVMEKIGQHLMEPGLKNRLYCLAWACPSRNGFRLVD